MNAPKKTLKPITPKVPSPQLEPMGTVPSSRRDSRMMGNNTGNTTRTETTSNTAASTPKTGNYKVYIDGFSSLDAAQAKVQELKSRGIDAFARQEGSRTVIKLGTFSSKENADAIAGQTGAKVVPAR
jgi:cell division septation protein DedD